MSVARTCTVVALTATAALTTTALAVAPAHTGGAPVLGTVTIDREARLANGQVTLSGTYSCTVPDAEVTSGPGTIGVELGTRSRVASSGSVAVTCDGSSRTWRITAPAGSMHPGRVSVSGHLEVPDAAGNTPWNLFDASVTVRRG